MQTDTSGSKDPTLVDATIDASFAAPPRPAAAARRAAATDASSSLCCQVELVRGANGELSRETDSLLRARLRMAATVLAAGFAVFLVRHFFVADFSDRTGEALFWAHAATTVVLALFALGLCHRHQFSCGTLRLSELVIFGLPAAFFLCVDYVVAIGSSERGYFEFPEGLWLLLMFTYALFIPNTLPRAIAVLGTMALLPLALTGLLIFAAPSVGGTATIDDFVGIAIMLLVSAGAGAFGVATIGALRREAFAARQLGQYRLTRRIGAGGMGEVYLAEHRLLKRPCVVKLIRPDRAGNPQAIARFHREVRSTAKLSHWNTVEIFDYGSTEDGTFYYVMEYLPGMSLGDMVEQFGPLPAARVVHLLRQACDALNEAHAAGLIHRDLKPGNIFAAKRGGVYDVAKLLDFGLVKHVAEDERALNLTSDGAITGSPLYMSPEQALGSAVDGRSDIYALGAVAYFLLTGRPPFVDDKPLKVIFAHAHDAVVPPSHLRADLPADLEQVVLRCLAKDPADRFADARALDQALSECESAGRWTREDATRWWQNPDVPADATLQPAEA